MKASSIRPRKAPKAITIKPDEEDTQEEQQEEIGPEKIVFVSERDGNREIYSMNPDGSEQTRLTNDPGYENLQPELSPDRHRIVFNKSLWGGPGTYVESYIYTMNADGSGQTKIADGEAPTWSPDGSKIAFFYGTDGTIRLVNSDGSNEKVITEVAYPNFSWCSDNRIVFPALHDNSIENFGVVDLNGDVTKFGKKHYVKNFMGWCVSPDGKSVVFGDYGEKLGDRNYRVELSRIDLDTGEYSVFRSFEHEVNCLAWPTWSPDGNWICFSDGNNGWLFNVYSGERKEYLSAEYWLGQAVWSPDSSRFLISYTGSPSVSESNIYLYTIDGGKIQLTDSGEDSQPHWR